MLRGRYGIGWMVVAWLAIVAALALAIFVVGQLPKLWAASSASTPS